MGAPTETSAMNQPLASIGDRFTAQFLDGFVAAGTGALFYFAAKAAGLPLELTILGWVLYLLICDGLPGGQSIGKKFTRSAVVHVDTGRPCSYLQSFVRNLCLIVLGVVDCAFIAGRQRRRLGDFIARTKVVRLAN
ncbi:RDD family protein [Aquabacterium soli]|nr:RDD family protein [Aquabacterium soli]